MRTVRFLIWVSNWNEVRDRLFPAYLAGSGVVSLLLIVLLAWAGIALVVIAAGFVITRNNDPPRYLTLVVTPEPSAEVVDAVEREAA